MRTDEVSDQARMGALGYDPDFPILQDGKARDLIAAECPDGIEGCAVMHWRHRMADEPTPVIGTVRIETAFGLGWAERAVLKDGVADALRAVIGHSGPVGVDVVG